MWQCDTQKIRGKERHLVEMSQLTSIIKNIYVTMWHSRKKRHSIEKGFPYAFLVYLCDNVTPWRKVFASLNNKEWFMWQCDTHKIRGI